MLLSSPLPYTIKAVGWKGGIETAVVVKGVALDSGHIAQVAHIGGGGVRT